MVFSDSHQTAAPATGTETAASVHHSASFLASGELKIVRRRECPSTLLIEDYPPSLIHEIRSCQTTIFWKEFTIDLPSHEAPAKIQ